MRTINLNGPQGNAFALLGLAKSWAQQLDYTPEEIDRLMNEMKSGDHGDLVSVFEQTFAGIVECVYE